MADELNISRERIQNTLKDKLVVKRLKIHKVQDLNDTPKKEKLNSQEPKKRSDLLVREV